MNIDPKVGRKLGLFGVLYLVFVIIIMLGGGSASQYATPFTELLFPTNEGKTLFGSEVAYQIMALSLVYWVGIALYLYIKHGPKDDD